MGITNNIATIPGIVAPSIVEAITEGKVGPIHKPCVAPEIE